MLEIKFIDLINIFDIAVLVIIFFSCFFAFKNGLIKSIFNLAKWIIIVILIKFSFEFLRPFFDDYIKNSTISDIAIFLATFICSYILLSTFNRILIGIIQPNKSGFGDYILGSIFGLLRGYIVVVLIFTSLNSTFAYSNWPMFLQSGTLIEAIQYGEEILDTIPKRVDDVEKYVT